MSWALRRGQAEWKAQAGCAHAPIKDNRLTVGREGVPVLFTAKPTRMLFPLPGWFVQCHPTPPTHWAQLIPTHPCPLLPQRNFPRPSLAGWPLTLCCPGSGPFLPPPHVLGCLGSTSAGAGGIAHLHSPSASPGPVGGRAGETDR